MSELLYETELVSFHALPLENENELEPWVAGDGGELAYDVVNAVVALATVPCSGLAVRSIIHADWVSASECYKAHSDRSVTM